MSTTKRHLKTDHSGDAEHISALRKGLRELMKEHGEDLTAVELAKFLDRKLGGLEQHKNMMSQAADTLYDDVKPQSHLVPALTAGQPYNSFQVIGDKAEGDELNKIVPDGIRSVIPPAPSTAEKVFGTEGLVMVPRAGQPTKPGRPNVSLEFEHLVKVDDE